jgi:hypothetical protein
MLSSDIKFYHLELMLSSENVIIWSYCYHLEHILSLGTKCYHGMKCYHLELMLSSGTKYCGIIM